MPDRDQNIEQLFPDIGNDYRITSPADPYYNCIAFAADDTKRWWEPGRYWPSGIPKRYDLESYIACYKSIGYQNCQLDESVESGYEKIAIFVDRLGLPTHAAKQTKDGKWKSKLGEYKDIEHTLEGISGHYHSTSYGNVAVIMKRKIK